MSAEGVRRVPPILLIHGADDAVVPSTSSHSMNVALALARSRAGVETGLDMYLHLDDVGHADFVTEIAFMEDETPAADRIFPVIKSFVDAVAANGLE